MSNDYTLAGVIGFPIGHSKSPRVHRFWLKHYGIPGDYVALQVAAQDVTRVVETLPAMGFAGINVTIPHKTSVLKFADRITDRAALIGAANTLTFRNGQIHADNTDAHGFLANLKQGASDWDSTQPALVLGAGGASLAVVQALLDDGVPEIRVSNRTKANAQKLRDQFGTRVQVVDWHQASEAVTGAGLIVNTTALGMAGNPALPLQLAAVDSRTVVTDIVYSPLETPLLQDARARGCQVVDGLGMLLHQAAPGFERWFGKKPKVTEELRKEVLS